MDYEQKYNEALEHARAEILANPGLRKTWEEIFPELRESEDERIRQTLIDMVKRETGFTGFPSQGQVLAYLEKQKEGEKEVSDLFDSTDSYNKGFRAGQEKSLQELKEHIKEDKTQCYAYDAGYAAGFIVGKEQGWKEHKAFVKEDSKTADSIPSDCVSDAKCEDRWHKVGDSLPDNPREVLCKDEAGNYFIGRYYVGEGWEISNYDDEDKPHHLNPPVSKWIDFPSEKQKEQSLRDFIDDFPYSDEQYTKRNALFDKCVENCDPEIMQRVSDEVDEMLGKEQKPASTEDMPYITDEHFYEREPADSFKYKLAEYMTKNCRKEESPDGYTYHISAETILKMAEEELLKRGVVQKPVEWSEEDEKMLVRLLDSISIGNDYEEMRNWLLSKLKSLRPQPKVELSEDVKKTLDEVSHILVGLNYKQLAKDYKQAIEKLLYSRPSWKPSEEDIKMLEHIIGQYETGNKNSKVMGYLPRVEELSFLKNVLSKWKN